MSGKNQEENEEDTSFSNKLGLSKKPSIKDVNEGRTWKEDHISGTGSYQQEREIDVEQQLKAFEKKKPSENEVEFSSDKDENLPENVSDMEENPHTMQGFEGRGHSRKTSNVSRKSNIVIVDDDDAKSNKDNSRDEAESHNGSDEEPHLSKQNSHKNGQALDLQAGKPERKKMMQGTAPKILVNTPQKENKEDNRETVDPFGGTDFNVNPPDVDTPGFFQGERQNTPKRQDNLWDNFSNSNDQSYDDSSFTKNNEPSIDDGFNGWNGFPGIPEENLPSKIKDSEKHNSNNSNANIDPFGAAFKKKKNNTPKIVEAIGTPKKPEDRLSFKKKTGDSFAISQNEDGPEKDNSGKVIVDPMDSGRKHSKKGNGSVKRLASISDNEHNQEDISVVEGFNFDDFDANSMSNLSNIDTVKAGEENPKKSGFEEPLDFDSKSKENNGKLSQSTPFQKESEQEQEDIDQNPLLKNQNENKNSQNSRRSRQKFSEDSDLMSNDIMDNISPIGNSNDFNKGFDNYNISQKNNQQKETKEGATDEHEIDLLSEDQNMSVSEKKIASPKDVKVTKKSSLGQLSNGDSNNQYQIKVNNQSLDSMKIPKSNSQNEILPKVPDFDRSNTDKVTISKERITTKEEEFDGTRTLTKKPKVTVEEKVTKTVQKANKEPQVTEVTQRKESVVGAIEKENSKSKQMSQEESELENMFLESFNASKSEIEIMQSELEGTPLGKKGDMNAFVNLFADAE